MFTKFISLTGCLFWRQITELHLDERLQVGRETLNKHLEIGQKRVTNAFGTLWADLEGFREAQRKRLEEQRASGSLPTTPLSSRRKLTRKENLHIESSAFTMVVYSSFSIITNPPYSYKY